MVDEEKNVKGLLYQDAYMRNRYIYEVSRSGAGGCHV